MKNIRPRNCGVTYVVIGIFIIARDISVSQCITYTYW